MTVDLLVIGTLGVLMPAQGLMAVAESQSLAQAIQDRFLPMAPKLGEDAFPRPPVLRDFVSPGETYHLILSTPNNWQTKQVIGSLYEVADNVCQLIWQQVLPQEYGPRLGLVNDQGQTLLLDEWINVASDYAIVVLDASGQLTAQHSFDEIVAVTRLDRADLVANAEQGFWISGTPTLKINDVVEIPVGNHQLVVNLDSGELRFD